MERPAATGSQNKTSVFSFFSGAGFLDLGFEHSGFDVCYVNEYHQPFLDAYKHSRCVLGIEKPRFGFDSASIEDLDTANISNWMSQLQSESQTIGFIGGPPCPDFSIGEKIGEKMARMVGYPVSMSIWFACTNPIFSSLKMLRDYTALKSIVIFSKSLSGS